VGEQDADEHREQRTEDAGKQPELPPAQNDDPIPARATGWRQTRFLVTESGLSQNGTPRFRDLRHRFVIVVPPSREVVRRGGAEGGRTGSVQTEWSSYRRNSTSVCAGELSAIWFPGHGSGLGG
jgi:hypothetical protein